MDGTFDGGLGRTAQNVVNVLPRDYFVSTKDHETSPVCQPDLILPLESERLGSLWWTG